MSLLGADLERCEDARGVVDGGHDSGRIKKSERMRGLGGKKTKLHEVGEKEWTRYAKTRAD